MEEKKNGLTVELLTSSSGCSGCTARDSLIAFVRVKERIGKRKTRHRPRSRTGTRTTHEDWGRGRGPRTRIEDEEELRTRIEEPTRRNHQRGKEICEMEKQEKHFRVKILTQVFFYTDMAWVACCKYIHIHTQLLNHTCAHRYNVAEKGQ